MASLTRTGHLTSTGHFRQAFRIPGCVQRTQLSSLSFPIRHYLNRNGWHSSSTSTATRNPGSLTRGLKNLLYGTSFVLLLTFGYWYSTDTRASIHQWLITPSLRWIYEDAEEAHKAGTRTLKILYDVGLHPRERANLDSAKGLEVEVLGTTVRNPIGISAGVDKNAEIPSPLLALGPAIVEIGGVTPQPQEGNPKPRVFRLPSQQALINRYGLNSDGADTVAVRLRERVRQFAYAMGYGVDEEAERRVLNGEAGVPPGSLVDGKLLAVQVAKNKSTRDGDIEAIKRDYVYCVKRLARYADIIVVNVSSPNTPGLRDLQEVEPLTDILTAVVAEAQAVQRRNKPAVMVKISPDEDSDAQIVGVCKAVHESGVDGVIVGNTTKTRPEPRQGYVLPAREAAVLVREQGGYSGPQTFEKTLSLVKRYRKALDDTTYEDDDNASPVWEEKNLSSSASTTHSDDDGETAPPPDPLFDLTPLPDPNPNPNPEPSSSSSSSSSSPSSSIITSLPRKKIIFASGGITTGNQLHALLDAGASLGMIYTALVYGGAGTVTRIKRELLSAVVEEGGGGGKEGAGG